MEYLFEKLAEPGVKLHKGRTDDQKRGKRVFSSFGKIPSRLGELGIVKLDGKKFEVATENVIKLIPREIQLPKAEENGSRKVKVFVQPDSWIRAKVISDIYRFSFNSVLLVSGSYTSEGSIFTSFTEESPAEDSQADTILAPLDAKVEEAKERIFYAPCSSEKLETNVKNRVQEILEFREESSQKNFDAEVECLIRLAILRVRLSKKVEEKPDLMQLEFLLYQYARARHVLATMENELETEVDKEKQDLERKVDWKEIHEFEEELALSISTADFAVKRFIEARDICLCSGFVDQIIRFSRSFSKFYSKCRVLPGCSGFHGDKFELIDDAKEESLRRLLLVEMFVDRMDTMFSLLGVSPLHSIKSCSGRWQSQERPA
ncbi:Oidioi.mRNA.OKI2018_I69.chr1.g3553.t1.cds [Oikopleura dioica]|uniref:Oidioi.mRNA.OKI2018_I69.chr1.g3553.t1.cds n=1 Tax=Oikopleura dioica TaxID=34765 RepID=A0ABN7SUB1_OIKDI|nr:Oidioi.mRNA.OKI2018_I69.chr1.g3553.t1.cds [Oikopleura dioica]